VVAAHKLEGGKWLYRKKSVESGRCAQKSTHSVPGCVQQGVFSTKIASQPQSLVGPPPSQRSLNDSRSEYACLVTRKVGWATTIPPWHKGSGMPYPRRDQFTLSVGTADTLDRMSSIWGVTMRRRCGIAHMATLALLSALMVGSAATSGCGSTSSSVPSAAGERISPASLKWVRIDASKAGFTLKYPTPFLAPITDFNTLQPLRAQFPGSVIQAFQSADNKYLFAVFARPKALTAQMRNAGKAAYELVAEEMAKELKKQVPVISNVTARSNTVQLTTMITAPTCVGGSGRARRGRSGKLLILRFTPRGLRRPRLETTRSCRISSSTRS